VPLRCAQPPNKRSAHHDHHTILNPRTLVTPELHTRLTIRIVTDRNLPVETAESITTQALAFPVRLPTIPAPASPSPRRSISAGKLS
jgi:hypothetical protein